MSHTGNSMAAYLSENPRMIGALFALCALLTQVGTVLAANGGGTSGP